jgi:hypothetical protein
MTDGTKTKLAYYSSIPCEATFGGPLQIYRHFREHNDFEFIDLNQPNMDTWTEWLGSDMANSKVFKRLANTRFHPYLVSRSASTLLGRETRRVATLATEAGAEAMVTVAYGRRCYVARNVAKRLGIPLITFYHDWWPDLVYSKTPGTLQFMDDQFRKLAQDSDLVLSVSTQLLEELGCSSRGVVLPPIPAKCALDEPLARQPVAERHGKLLVYAGTLQGPYGAMVRELGMAILAQPDAGWTLRAYGPATDWSVEEREHLTLNGVYGGVLAQGQDLQAALEAADALLVVMDFETENRRRVKTSFPSKILDYAQIGKPIVAWGPEDCFASLFTVEQQLGHCWTKPTANGLIRDLNTSWSDDKRIRSTQAVRDLSMGSFSTDAIHGILQKAVGEMFGK